MKIGFDVSDLCTGRADGTTNYTKELVKKLSSEVDWHLFAPCTSPLALLLEKERGHSWHGSPWPKFWTQSRLPVDLWRYPVDVLFMPIQQLPYFRPRKMRTVAVIHDLACHDYGEQYRLKDWLLLHVFSAQVAREADSIICISQSTADDLEKYYGRTNGVHVVHHGVDNDRFYLPDEDEKNNDWHVLQAKYQELKKPFILYVGQIQPRKNLVRLVEAFERLAISDDELQLVIAGGHGWMQQPIVNKIRESTFSDRILLLGRVSDELLSALYWHAETFALISLNEGFGMPILEAMAAGCPVVTSNVSAMPEVAGDAAVLVEPKNVESIADGIKRALSSKDEWRDKGLARAREFSWDKCYRETLDILRK